MHVSNLDNLDFDMLRTNTGSCREVDLLAVVSGRARYQRLFLSVGEIVCYRQIGYMIACITCSLPQIQ